MKHTQEANIVFEIHCEDSADKALLYDLSNDIQKNIIERGVSIKSIPIQSSEGSTPKKGLEIDLISFAISLAEIIPQIESVFNIIKMCFNSQSDSSISLVLKKDADGSELFQLNANNLNDKSLQEIKDIFLISKLSNTN